MNTAVKTLLKIALAAALAAILLSHLKFATAFDKVRAVDPSAVLASFLMIALAVVSAAFKFRLALDDFFLWPVLRTTVLLQFYNLYLPGQLGGELLRIYMLGGRRGEAHRVIAATILDRLTGLVALCVLMVWAFAAAPWHMGRPLTTMLIILTAGTWIGFFLLAYFEQKWVEGTMLRLHVPERFRQIVQSCLSAVQQFARRPKFLAQSLVLGLLHQVLIIGSFMFLGAGLGIHVSPATWTIVVGISSLILVLPITFAGIGTRDISLVATLGLAGVQPEAALALSLAVFAVQTVFSATCGLLLLTPRPTSVRSDQASAPEQNNASHPSVLS